MLGTIKAGVKEQTLVQVVDFASSLLEFVGSFAGPDPEAAGSYALPEAANSPGFSYASLLKTIPKKLKAPTGHPDPWHRVGRVGEDRATDDVHYGEYGQTRSVRSSRYSLRPTIGGKTVEICLTPQPEAGSNSTAVQCQCAHGPGTSIASRKRD